MIGSNILEKVDERPSRKPKGVPRMRAMAYPLATITNEYQVNRRIPWSSSSRLAKGSTTYLRVFSQVWRGPGKS